MHRGILPCWPCRANLRAPSFPRHLSVPGSRPAPVPEPALGTATLPEERLCSLLPVCRRDGTPHAAPGHMASSCQHCLGCRNRHPKSSPLRQMLTAHSAATVTLGPEVQGESFGSHLLPQPGFYCSTVGKSSPGLALLPPTRSAVDPPFRQSSLPQPWGQLLSSLLRLGVFCPKLLRFEPAPCMSSGQG